jgi:anti-repressor protein
MFERRIKLNNLQIFNNPEFGQVRTLDIGGKPYFVASDIAKALGYRNFQDAVIRHCRWVVKHDVPHPQSNGKTIAINAIPEGDIYRLISHSELPSAEKFESWVFDEVLPSIRKHGMYATDELINNPDLLIQVASALKEEREKNKQLSTVNTMLLTKSEQDKPKVIFADAVASSDKTILIGELAKIIKQNGIDIGEKRLFAWLRENGYLIKRKGTDFNAPTQRSMEQELFTVKETAISHSDGHVTVNKTTKVTGKGQQYFINKFLGQAQLCI